jgi:hypothetical protein
MTPKQSKYFGIPQAGPFKAGSYGYREQRVNIASPMLGQLGLDALSAWAAV